MPPDLRLPRSTRLLHVGPMKTGTTSVQAAASSQRKKLLDHDVRYPGNLFNHRRHFGALIGWSVDTWRREGPLRPDLLDIDTAGIPPWQMWEDLRAEITGESRRVFLTHEFISQADHATCQRIADELDDLHVVITLRAPGQIVPSLWTQSVRDDAQTEPFLDWIDRFYNDSPDFEDRLPERYQRAYDQDQLVDQWARIVGPENVTVIIADSRNPDQMTDAFETLLGLPEGMLRWRQSNPSLTAVDAELFRRINLRLRAGGADWWTFYHLVWKGAVKHGPEKRKHVTGEPRVLLPPWAARIAHEDGHRFADHLRQSPVRVIGDPAQLEIEPRSAEWPELDDIPIGAAASAWAAAAISEQQQRNSLRRKLDPEDAALELEQGKIADLRDDITKLQHELAELRQTTNDFTGRELLEALRLRTFGAVSRRFAELRQ